MKPEGGVTACNVGRVGSAIAGQEPISRTARFIGREQGGIAGTGAGLPRQSGQIQRRLNEWPVKTAEMDIIWQISSLGNQLAKAFPPSGAPLPSCGFWQDTPNR